LHRLPFRATCPPRRPPCSAKQETPTPAIASTKPILQLGHDTVLFPWAGSRATATLTAQLTAAGLEASDDGLVITIPKTNTDQIRDQLRALVDAGPADPVALAARVENKAAAKYDDWIEDSLLSADYACRALDCPGAWRVAGVLLVDESAPSAR
jgi:ATP-dependent helicase Lhr and Lhr-like helicase